MLNLDIDLVKNITFIDIISAIYENFPLILNVLNFTTKSLLQLFLPRGRVSAELSKPVERKGALCVVLV